MARILVVDDDPDMRELVKRHLAAAGHDVALAPGADTARESIAARPPDLIITDVDMPGTTGDEFASSLGGTIPVIYLTALRPDAELAVKTLGYPLLTKPLVAKELLAMVARQLPRRAAPP